MSSTITRQSMTTAQAPAPAAATPAKRTATPGDRLALSRPGSSTAHKLANGAVAFVALEHVGFLGLEMFAWAKPLGMKIFGTTAEFAAASAKLAANQGLYNGFLAAGLLFSLLPGKDHAQRTLKMFCLGCVAVAGIFGGLTTKLSILFVQAVPALIAMGLVWNADRKAGN